MQDQRLLMGLDQLDPWAVVAIGVSAIQFV